MAVNYFMVTKDGVDLYADYPDIARGSVAVATAVADKVRKTRVNLLPNGSFESAVSGWSESGGSFARSSAVAFLGSWSGSLTASGASASMSFQGEVHEATVVPGRQYMASAVVRSATLARTARVNLDWGSAGFSSGTYVATTVGGWTFLSLSATAPVGAATAKVEMQFATTSGNLPAGEVHYFDDLRLEEVLDPTITGVPADLAPMQWLFKGKGYSVAPRDIVAPTGFVQSVFRAVRDPAIVTDDSGTSLAMQVYNHGWVMGVPLACYLAENPFDGVAVPWPADGGYKVVPVTGNPAVNDGAGTYGFQTVTWPGSSVGVGTLRQVVSGDEGSTRKVAAILDMLAPLGDAERSNIASVFSGTRASIETARQNLETVIGAATDAVRAQVDGRSALAGILGCNAVAASAIGSLRTAVLWAMRAIVAKEAGLVLDGFPGTRLSVANYETLTQPLDQVLVMPAGY